MLRKKILRKIYFTTLILFILFLISSFTLNKNISNIKVNYQTKLSSIYLLDDNNYLLKVNVLVEDNIMDNIPLIINSLKSDNKHYSGLRGIIPPNTVLNNMNLKNGILSLDFNQELLNINQNLEEKVIESLVYSLLDFKEIKGIKISINQEPLKMLPKSKIIIDDILTKDFGINKEYSLNSIQDIQKVILYYYESYGNNDYYVPITKYLNSKDDKIKVVIDNLKNDYLSQTNLMSYLNEKVLVDSYSLKDKIITLSFKNVLDFSNDIMQEEIIYTLSNSLMDSLDVEKVIFLANDNIIAIKEKK